MTWGGVLQASVITWGEVTKPRAMPRDVEVPPPPLGLLERHITRSNYVLSLYRRVDRVESPLIIGRRELQDRQQVVTSN